MPRVSFIITMTKNSFLEVNGQKSAL